MFSALHHNVSTLSAGHPPTPQLARVASPPLLLLPAAALLTCVCCCLCTLLQGKRLHELAREGVTAERQARPVTVTRFDVHRCV